MGKLNLTTNGLIGSPEHGKDSVYESNTIQRDVSKKNKQIIKKYHNQKMS